MIQSHHTKAPLIVILAVIIIFCLVVAIQVGLSWEVLGLFLMAIVSLCLSGFSFSLYQKSRNKDRHTKQLRFIADRFQAMLRTYPGGYCLFTPQGLLREEHGVSIRFGLDKLAHFDELASAIKEEADLISSFRRLQQTGDGFSLIVHGAKNDFTLRLTGRRFRVGHDGPQVDILWFCENPAMSDVMNDRVLSITSSTSSGSVADVQDLLDAIPFPVWARGRDLKIVLCNKAYAKTLDQKPEEVVRDQSELMSQTARGGSGKTLSANVLAKGSTQTERRHVIINGKRRLLEITELLLSNEKTSCDQDKKTTPTISATFGQAVGTVVSGNESDQNSEIGLKKDPESATAQAISQVVREASNAIHIMGFAIDVTVEEEKDTELKRHLAAHHEVMEHLGAAVAVFGPDTKLEFYNRAYQRLWEAQESFLDSKPTLGEILEDLRTRRKMADQVDFQRYKRERLSLFTSLLEPQEDLMYLPDGTTLRVLCAPHPLGGIMFVHEDVTDRLALESSYNTLIAVQRETLDNLAEGIAVFGSDGKLRLSNPAFGRIWKLSRDFLSTEPHVSELLEHMKSLFSYGANWSAFKTEMVGYTLDRNPRTGRIERADQAVIQFLTVPLPDGAVLNSYLDITDSVCVEQALRASNAALATADRLKSDFVANVSYQLRTPLNTITGFADILTEQYFGTLNPRQMEYTQTIKSESEKLARIINDVLDLATIEAGRMMLERHPVAIADLLNSAKQMTAEWARQQSLDIVIDCPLDLGSFEVDVHRMKQVMFSLISNSIKYTPSGGRIVLSARKQDDWAIVSVIDTGVGIPEEDIERVFGKFERANTELRQSGAGLGLSLVKSLVELHGGRVELISDPQNGTVVSFFMPVKAQDSCVVGANKSMAKGVA